MARAPWEVKTFWNSVCFDPVTLTTVAAVASVGGSIVSGIGQMRAGQAANNSAKFQAAQMQQQAGQDRASSQRVAIEERRRAGIAMSNAQAGSAASGGGATDPTVMNLTGAIAGQGEYNALSALFEGEERARGRELAAASARMEGKQAKKAGMIGGISTIASGAGNALMMKYAPSGGVSGKTGTVGTAGVGGTRAPWQQPGMFVPSYAGGGSYA